MQNTKPTVLTSARFGSLLVFLTIAVFFSCNTKEEKAVDAVNAKAVVTDGYEQADTTNQASLTCRRYAPANLLKNRILEVGKNRAPGDTNYTVILAKEIENGKFFIEIRQKVSQTLLHRIELKSTLPPTGREPKCPWDATRDAYFPADLAYSKMVTFGDECAESGSGYSLIFRRNQAGPGAMRVFMEIVKTGTATRTLESFILGGKIPPEVGS